MVRYSTHVVDPDDIPILFMKTNLEGPLELIKDTSSLVHSTVRAVNRPPSPQKQASTLIHHSTSITSSRLSQSKSFISHFVKLSNTFSRMLSEFLVLLLASFTISRVNSDSLTLSHKGPHHTVCYKYWAELQTHKEDELLTIQVTARMVRTNSFLLTQTYLLTWWVDNLNT